MRDVGYVLYQWFVDTRRRISGRLRSRLLLGQARSILGVMVVHNAANGLLPDVPVIDRAWLMRWRFNYGVSLKKPSKRFKVKRSVLKARLLIFWSNVLVVRWFLWKRFGIDPKQEQYDQKGVHMNEAGSKNVPTYEMPGRVDIPLKENHHQTRERVSWMTGCFSNLLKARRRIPFQTMFKAQGKRILKDLTVTDEGRYSLQTSPSGSYRAEHVMGFLRRHLPEWTDEREKEKDWRILSLDAYSPHKNPEIAELCWSRGYLYHEGLMVPGGATGVVQGPDTDLHAWLEAELLELQSMEEHEKLQKRPAKNHRRRDKTCWIKAYACGKLQTIRRERRVSSAML